MAEDVAPALLERIRADFENRVSASSTIKTVANRIRDGTATLVDAHKYAERLGEILSDVLLSNLTEDALPDGRLYWNIADRTIRPMLENNYALTNATAAEIQALVDRAAGLGIASISSELPTGRIKGLLDKATAEETFEGMTRWLVEPVVNCSESFFDDFVVANAQARYRAGMSVTIERRLGSSELRSIRRGKTAIRYHVPCKWCQRLAGSYDYGSLSPGDDVYRRHEFCRCVVTFKSGRLQQDVHSKRWYDDSGTSLSDRRRINLDVLRRTPEEASLLEQALQEEDRRLARERREAAIRSYQRENNVSHRRAANRLTRLGTLSS